MNDGDDDIDVAIAIFFVSFVLIVGIVLLNVVIACLLDKFICTMQEVKEQDEKAAREEASTSSSSITLRHGPLDMMLKQLLTYVSRCDLNTKIENIWDLVDVNGDGLLSCNEMNKGLALLDVEPPIHLSTEDFFGITHGLLDKENRLSKDRFGDMIMRELHVYMERQLVRAIKYSNSANDTGMLCALKLLVSPLFKDVHNPKMWPQSATHVFDQHAAQSSAPIDPGASDSVTASSAHHRGRHHALDGESNESADLVVRMEAMESRLEARLENMENDLASIVKVCKKLAGECSCDARAAPLSVSRHRSSTARITRELADRSIVDSNFRSQAPSLVNTRKLDLSNLPPGPDQGLSATEPETSKVNHAHSPMSSSMNGKDESAELGANGDCITLDTQVHC